MCPAGTARCGDEELAIRQSKGADLTQKRQQLRRRRIVKGLACAERGDDVLDIRAEARFERDAAYLRVKGCAQCRKGSSRQVEVCNSLAERIDGHEVSLS
jgi:hypothetical protein